MPDSKDLQNLDGTSDFNILYKKETSSQPEVLMSDKNIYIFDLVKLKKYFCIVVFSEKIFYKTNCSEKMKQLYSKKKK